MNPRNRRIHRILGPLVFVLLALGLALLSAACNKDYQCQVVCRFPSGNVQGSSTTITVSAGSVDEANQNCPAEAQKNIGTACGNGAATIVSCSCYDATAKLDPPAANASAPVVAFTP
jgi:hypothetical protein